MAFVNAVAWISHREDHHPDLLVSYNKCRVEYMTHAVGGLSENDFICAASGRADRTLKRVYSCFNLPRSTTRRTCSKPRASAPW